MLKTKWKIKSCVKINIDYDRCSSMEKTANRESSIIKNDTFLFLNEKNNFFKITNHYYYYYDYMKKKNSCATFTNSRLS